MNKPLRWPVSYLITRGEATPENFDKERAAILAVVGFAAANGINLIQIREKQITTAQLNSLVAEAAKITGPTNTRLLVNDRVDVAIAAGADGVHLTTYSLPLAAVRKTFRGDLLVAVSAHTLQEASDAARDGADLVVFGPVFNSPGKGMPTGLQQLSAVCKSLEGFPVLGLGGVDVGNYRSVLDAGAAGFAAIRSLNDPETLNSIVTNLEKKR